jgi:hypothetical protein
MALAPAPALSLPCWRGSRPRRGPTRCTRPPSPAGASRGHGAVRTAPPSPRGSMSARPGRATPLPLSWRAAPPRSGRRSSAHALALASACPSPWLARPARRSGPGWPAHARGAQHSAARLARARPRPGLSVPQPLARSPGSAQRPRLARPCPWRAARRGAAGPRRGPAARAVQRGGQMANLLCAWPRHGSRRPRSASAARVSPAQLFAPLSVGQD